MNKKLRIAITGATGLLGRNLLFEIIKQNISNLDNLEIFILGRDKNNMNIQQRIKDIILNDGVYYISSNGEQRKVIKDFYERSIKCLKIDLDEEKLNIVSDDFKKLDSAPVDIFFHNAALTDLRDTPTIAKALKRTNIFGTQQILQLLSSLNKVGEFCYVGTAYSCGNVVGNIRPDVVDLNQKFRNPYEQSKLEAEVLVRNFSKKTRIRCRYFRPSVICGRLIEPPLGSICKFDVFYGWAAFFFQIKLKHSNSWEDKYEGSFKVDLRIYYNLKSGLNIIPADFAAKVMYQVCAQKDSGDSYHLVNNQETPHSLYIPIMLSKLNITGPTQVNSMPSDMNKFEHLYYKTAGKVLTPYITSKPMLFDTKNLDKILDKVKLRCPPVDERTFPILMDFAKKQAFGLAVKQPIISSS